MSLGFKSNMHYLDKSPVGFHSTNSCLYEVQELVEGMGSLNLGP